MDDERLDLDEDHIIEEIEFIEDDDNDEVEESDIEYIDLDEDFIIEEPEFIEDDELDYYDIGSNIDLDEDYDDLNYSSFDDNSNHSTTNSNDENIPQNSDFDSDDSNSNSLNSQQNDNLNKSELEKSNLDSQTDNSSQSELDKNNLDRQRNGNFNNAKPNNSNSKDSEMLKKCLDKGKNKNLAKNNAQNRDNEAAEEKENLKDKVEKKAGEEAVSALAQAYGVPKPIADTASKEIVGPLLEKKKEQQKKIKKLYMIVIGCALFMILIPILVMGSDKDYQDSNSETRAEYLYGSGSEESLYEYLKEMGLCDDIQECSSTDAAKFYKELKNVLNNNILLTPKHADSFIIKMILYGRDEQEAYKHIEEIKYIADIIGKDTAFNITNAENYRDEFIKENGYFDTYRSEDLFAKNNTRAYKIEVYNNIVKAAKQLITHLEASSREEENNGPQVCSYNVNGKKLSDIKVRLLQCGDDDRGEPIEGEELVDFEKYILGVVYAENGNGSTESMKAQAIAARTYSLLRGDKMGGAANLGLTYENGKWILSIRNCTEDQVYCDPDKGCWSNDKYAGGTVHSGYDSSKTYRKGSLSATSPIRAAVEETAGKVLVGADGSLLYTTYTQTQQDIWNNNAKEGKDHFELLKLTYPSSSRIASTCTGTTNGEYKKWKQCKQAWSSIKLGKSSSNICDAGCYITSIAIQMAASGTKINSKEFNPGVLVNHLSSNYAFSGDGSLTTFAWTNLAPNFKFYTSVNLSGSQSQKAAVIKQYQDSGYYVVIRAKTNQHWVALDRVEGDQVYMFDPGSSATKLWERYPSNDVTKITIFQKVD